MIAVSLCLLAAAQAQVKSKPKLRVAADGFPAGHATPEGVACDLARAFIQRDSKLFKSSIMGANEGAWDREKYAAFIKRVAEDMRKELQKPKPSPEGPKSLGKC